MNAARLASVASGRPLTDHKILFFGAGSAGIGVAKQLLSFFTLMGMSEEEAKKKIYVRGILHYGEQSRFTGFFVSFRPWTRKA